MSASPPPPRLAERLLARTVRDDDWRDSILGDLREEFAVAQKTLGHRAARRWYWSQALAIGARGLTARVRPRRGSLVQSAEIETRTGWGAGWSRDFRHAWRTIARRPAASAVIVVTLALAIATNSTSFAILDALVFRPFRFPDLDRLVVVASSDPRQGLFDRESVTAGDFADWRRESRTVTHLSAAEWWDANLSGIEYPEQVAGFRVTAHFFDALGARPMLGRPFAADEETPGRHQRVVLGHALWTRLYAADPAILGRTIRLDGEPYEVVGVAPPDFAIPLGAEVWAPLAYTPEEWTNRRARILIAIGRLADGASMDAARAEMAAIADRQRREHPETNANLPNAVVPFVQGMADPGAAVFVGSMQAASLLLLLIACANIANLLLATGGDRAQELGMRLALGAGRTRLASQLLLEAGLLTTLAIVVAMPITWAWLGLSRAAIPETVVRFVPGLRYMAPSPAVFWSAAAFGALATLVFGLIPAWQAVRGDVVQALRQGSRTATASRQRHWLRNTLAVSQVALTLALLFGAALMMGAASRAVDGSFGFDKRNLLVARLVLPERPYADPERRRQVVGGVLDRVRAIPAVTSASMASTVPYAGSNSTREIWPDGVVLQRGEVRYADYRRVTPEYFDTMKIPLVAGRALNAGDRADTPAVAVVSQRFATRYWSGEDPIGRQFRIARDGAPITVVGVVGDVVHDWFQQRRGPTAYRPLAQEAPFGLAFVVRTIGEPGNVAGDLRRAVRAVDPDQPVIALGSMEALIEERTAGLTYVARSLSVVAVIALVVAVMGLYSLMSFLVGRRRQELGVRMALGATRWQVIGLTTRQGLRITVAGLVVGGAAAYALGRLMESMLFGVVASGAWPLAVLAILIAGVCVIASYIPARRTADLDPTMALRAE